MNVFVSCFFFNVTATTEIYTLSLHDALPILYAEILRRRGVSRQDREESALALSVLNRSSVVTEQNGRAHV